MRVVRRAGARQARRLDRFFARIIVKRRSYVEKLDDIAAMRAASSEQNQRSPFKTLRRVSQ
ncbi:hypothetical protein X737_22490 [Mesorhizobium sp. L48C026A00]|nr:hypothetical protein [Mesorhizobium sp. L48C026A00]ESZ15304.1 hypothetical protein X737_22490 [Mesorhizobium sp. L48C026A00]